MFHIGQRVRVRTHNYKTKIGAIGTVVGYYEYYEMLEDDEFEWEVDSSKLLIRFDDPYDTAHPTTGAWNEREDAYMDPGMLYVRDCYVEELFGEGGKLEYIKEAISNRHNEYKKRMLL